MTIIISLIYVNEYQGLVDHLKDVVVNGHVSHTSTKTNFYYVIKHLGEDDISPFKETVGESKNQDYDFSNSYLVRKGIDNYLSNQN